MRAQAKEIALSFPYNSLNHSLKTLYVHIFTVYELPNEIEFLLVVL